MKFAHRLKISSAVSSWMLLVVVPMLLYAFNQKDVAAKKDILADDIQTVIFQRVTHRDRYFLFGELDSAAKWRQVTARAGALLQQAEGVFGGEQGRRLKGVQENFRGTVDLFNRLYERGQSLRLEGAWRLHDDPEGRLLYRAIMERAAALREAARQLQQLCREDAAEATQRLAVLAGIFICLLGVIVYNAMLAHRLLRRRLHALHAGAAALAGGELAYRIDCTGEDELCELASVINAMAEQVQRYTGELQKSHHLLDALSSEVPGILFQARRSDDGVYSIPYASRGMRDLYEVEPEDVAQDVNIVFSRFHPEDRDALIASFEHSVATLSPWHHEYRFIAPSGVKHCYGVARPQRMEDGSILWNGFIADISQRKELEDRLLENQARFRSLFDHTHDAIFLTRPDGEILAANPAACEMLGRTEEEIRACGRTGVVDLGDPLLVPALEERARTGQFHGELTFLRNDGTPFPVEITSVMARDGSGRYECSIIARDITGRKREEQILAEAKVALEEEVRERTRALCCTNQLLIQEIEERKRAQEELLAQQRTLEALSHDLALAEERERDRIAGELHDQVGQRLILAKMKLDGVVRRLCATPEGQGAEEVTELLSQTIQDIRTLTFQLRPPLLASAGLEAAVLWLGEEMKRDFGLTLHLSDDKSEKPLKYEVRSTVFQAVRELLMNVAKHAGTDSVLVAMKREGRHLSISVEDRGEGFVPTEGEGRASAEGGFGLLNVHRRISHLGGTMSFHSEPGLGTRVTVTVPLDQVQVDMEGS